MERLRYRWILWRNRLLGSARFQRWAANTPGVRGIARGRARGLFDIVAGFVYSQVALACVETGLLPFLAAGRRDVAAVAKLAGLPPEGALRLLKAAAALDLAESVGGDFVLGAHGAALLANPGVAEMIAHHRALYADLADPVALLRAPRGGGALAAYWPYAAAGDEPVLAAAGDRPVAAYSALMAASQPMLAEQILDAYPVGRHRRLLDVGGGEGVFLRAAGARAPALELGLFDLPAVVARLPTGRIVATGGSFVADPLPGGADLISLVRVLHDHDDDVVAALLAKVRVALVPGGTVLVAEPMADTPGARPIGEAYFGLYLWAMGSGRPRTADELRGMLAAAGFGRVRERPTRLPLIVQVITAQVL